MNIVIYVLSIRLLILSGIEKKHEFIINVFLEATQNKRVIEYFQNFNVGFNGDKLLMQ